MVIRGFSLAGVDGRPMWKHCCVESGLHKAMWVISLVRCGKVGGTVAVTFLLLLLPMFVGKVCAQDEPRWALVVGNNIYQHVVSLKTAVNDAATMASALRQLRFDVLNLLAGA